MKRNTQSSRSRRLYAGGDMVIEDYGVVVEAEDVVLVVVL